MKRIRTVVSREFSGDSFHNGLGTTSGFWKSRPADFASCRTSVTVGEHRNTERKPV